MKRNTLFWTTLCLAAGSAGCVQTPACFGDRTCSAISWELHGPTLGDSRDFPGTWVPGDVVDATSTLKLVFSDGRTWEGRTFRRWQLNEDGQLDNFEDGGANWVNDVVHCSVALRVDLDPERRRVRPLACIPDPFDM